MKVQWFSSRKSGDVFGLLVLSENLLEERQIQFSGERKLKGGRFEKLFSGEVYYDYVCVQSVDDFPSRTSWSAHGKIVKVRVLEEQVIDSGGPPVNNDPKCQHQTVTTTRRSQQQPLRATKPMKKRTVFITFKIFKESPPLIETEDNVTYSIEFLQKTVSTIRQEKILQKLKPIDFAANIILGNDMPGTVYPETSKVMHQVKTAWKNMGHSPFNEYQISALEKAFSLPLSLIWGPPGTGKTLTACIVAYAFSLLNKEYNQGCEPSEKRMVLYCGPSNASMDVVAKKFYEKFSEDSCPKILRIYGRQTELSDFPIPGETENFSRSQDLVQVPAELQSISLHHLIRKSDRPYSERLIALDQLLARKIKSISKKKNYMLKGDPDVNADFIKHYKQLVRKAEIEEIQQYDIVICTAAVSGSPFLQSFCHFAQIIVDEAGMCKETETLVPLAGGRASSSCRNAVLIGDHKQLRPIIIDNMASTLGLKTSLFERYFKLKKHKLVTTLNRMFCQRSCDIYEQIAPKQ